MNSDAKRFGELLGAAAALRSVLEDANVRFVAVTPNGEFSYVKLGRRRPGESALERSDVERLAACVQGDTVLRWHEWAIRSYAGSAGKSLLIERLPAAVVDRLPNDVLAQLRRQIRRDGNGIIVGLPGASKGALLLWLAMQIPDESIVVVSENPPTELPGSHVFHVYPPTSEADRRKVERLTRLSDIVFWDRVTGEDDLRTLFGFPGARRRWFTLDASSISSALRTLLGVMSSGTDARIETILSLRSSVIGRPEVTNLLLKEDDWVEIYKQDDSALDAVGAFSSHDVAKLGLTRRSEKSGTFDAIPPAPKNESKITSETAGPPTTNPELIAPDIEIEEPALPNIPEPEVAGIEENTAAGNSLDLVSEDTSAKDEKETGESEAASRPASFAQPESPKLDFGFDDDDMFGEPVEEAGDQESEFEFPVEEKGLANSSSVSAGILKKVKRDDDHPLTIPVDADDISEVSEATAEEDAVKTGLLNSSDLAGLAQASRAQNLPEETRQYSDIPDAATSNADASILADLLPKIAGEEPPPPEVNLEDLRITTMEEYTPEDEGSGEFDLDMTNRSDNFAPHTGHSEFSDLDEESSDFSEVVEDFEIGDLDDLISEDDIATSIAGAEAIASAISNPFEDDIEIEHDPTIQGAMTDATSPAIDTNYLMNQIQDEDMTEEVSLNTSKLQAIRQRLSQKE